MASLFGCIVIMVAAATVKSVELYPFHASCNIDWTFEGGSCADVNKALVAQMKTWESADNCHSGGEKCLYVVKSHSPAEIKATHETPKRHYVDDLSFTFTEDTNLHVCRVHGYSTSETWYAHFDFGTNYCNLHNLITGAELDQASGYSETTSDSQCTQYTSADCKKY